MSFAKKRYRSFVCSPTLLSPTLFFSVVVEDHRHDMPTKNGTTMKWLCLRTPFLPTALSCAPFVTKLAHARFMMSCATMGAGKSTLLTLMPFPLSDHNPPKTARSWRKRTAGSFFLALRKYHRHLPTPYTSQMTQTRKVQLCAASPCCVMLVVSCGTSTQT